MFWWHSVHPGAPLQQHQGDCFDPLALCILVANKVRYLLTYVCEPRDAQFHSPDTLTGRLVASDSEATLSPVLHVPTPFRALSRSSAVATAGVPIQHLNSVQAKVRRTLVSRWYSAMLIRFKQVLKKMDIKSEVCKPARLPPDYAESEDIVGFVQERVQFAQRRAQAILKDQQQKLEEEAEMKEGTRQEHDCTPAPAPLNTRQPSTQPKVVPTRVKTPEVSKEIHASGRRHAGMRYKMNSPQENVSGRQEDLGGKLSVLGAKTRPLDRSGDGLDMTSDLRKSRGYIEAEGLARLGDFSLPCVLRADLML